MHKLAHNLPQHAPAPLNVPHSLSACQDHLPGVEAQKHHGGIPAPVDQAREHVALVSALHGHALVHLLDVEDLVGAQRDLRVRHDVLHVAVDNVIPGVHEEVAGDPRDAHASQEALVPGFSYSQLAYWYVQYNEWKKNSPRLDPHDDQLAAREQQRCAAGIVDPDGDGGEALAVVRAAGEKCRQLFFL